MFQCVRHTQGEHRRSFAGASERPSTDLALGTLFPLELAQQLEPAPGEPDEYLLVQ